MSPPESDRLSPTLAPRPAASLSATQVFLRGLALALPTILTLLILVWIASGINSFVIRPISSIVRFAIALAVENRQVRPAKGMVKADGLPGLPYCERNYLVLPGTRTELLEEIAQTDAASREKSIEEVRRRLERGDLAFFRFDD